MNPKVEFHFKKGKAWREEMTALRALVLSSGLTEELKWGQPCYTLDTHNVLLLHGFKDYCAILFMKGALLNDTKRILIQQTKNVQAGRQIRFTNVTEIEKQKATIKAYIKEAIIIEKAGLKTSKKDTEEYEMPRELEEAFKKNPRLKSAFYELTPGRQRGYLLYFAGAKQVKTRESRIEKYANKIIDGYGFND